MRSTELSEIVVDPTGRPGVFSSRIRSSFWTATTLTETELSDISETVHAMVSVSCTRMLAIESNVCLVLLPTPYKSLAGAGVVGVRFEKSLLIDVAKERRDVTARNWSSPLSLSEVGLTSDKQVGGLAIAIFVDYRNWIQPSK